MTCVTLQNIQFRDFRGGVNTKDGPFNLKDSEAVDALNVTLTERGALKQRLGKSRFDTSGFPATKRAEHMRPWYPGASKILFLSIDGTIYTSDAAGALTSRFAGTAGNHWMFEDMQDAANASFMFAVNGLDQPKKLSTALAVTDWTDATGTNAILVGNKPHCIRVWRNRMVVAYVDSRRLDFSKIGDPNNFTDTDFQLAKTASDERDSISWLEVLDDTLIAFTPGAVFGIYGEPPAIQMKVIGSPGCEGRFQSCVMDGRCFYWNRAGLWSTDGVQPPVYESSAVESWIAENLSFANISKVRLAPSRDRRIFVALPITATNDRVIEFIPYLAEPNEEGVRPYIPAVFHDWPIASMCTFRPSDIDVLVAGNAANVGVHNLFTGANDDGVAISSSWQSSWKSLYPEEPFERLRRVNLLMDGQAEVDIFRDFSETPDFTAHLEIPGASDPLWDGPGWGGGIWNEASSAGIQRVRPETRARYHSFRIRNNVLNKSWTLLSAELVIRGGREH